MEIWVFRQRKKQVCDSDYIHYYAQNKIDFALFFCTQGNFVVLSMKLVGAQAYLLDKLGRIVQHPYIETEIFHGCIMPNQARLSSFGYLGNFIRMVLLISLCGSLLAACGGSAGTVGIATGTAFYSTAPSSITIPVGTVNYTVGGGTGPYKSSSSNTNVAIANLKDNKLSITGLAAGTAQINILDATGASIVITTTVGAGTSTTALYTSAPGPIMLAVGKSSSFSIGGGKPSYLASSSNAAVATASINGDSLNISGLSAGSAQIAVFDSSGTSVSIGVTVGSGGAAQALFIMSPNAITTAINETSSFTIGGGSAPYTVASSNAGIATVTLVGTTLKVIGIAKGKAQVMAFDTTGASVSIAVDRKSVV